jgi:hypothetical protein
VAETPTKVRWDIDPRVSVGPLRAKMTRPECREAIGTPFDEFRKGPSSPNTTDAFDTVGVHAYYDAEQLLTYVEVHLFGSVVPVLRGIDLAGSWEQCIADLESVGLRCQVVEDESAQVGDTGVRLYRYDPSEPDVVSVEIELPSEGDIPRTPPTP